MIQLYDANVLWRKYNYQLWILLLLIVVAIFVWVFLSRRGTECYSDIGEINVISSVDGTIQKALLYIPNNSNPPYPLLVGLHSWSTNYLDDGNNIYKDLCKKYSVALILPDFRGPNNSKMATGSTFAIEDVIDAINYVKRITKISKVIMIGMSGGGHAALQVSSRYPEYFAAVAAWCPIVDLTDWYYETNKNGFKYKQDIIYSTGGHPGASKEIDMEYTQRSPINMINKLKNSQCKVNLYAGIYDNRVSPLQSIKAFRELCGVGSDNVELTGLANRYLRGKDINQGSDGIIYQKTCNNSQLILFDGGHKMIHKLVENWLKLFIS